MYEGTIWEKIWKVIYPVLIYFFIQIFVRFIGESILTSVYTNSLQEYSDSKGIAASYGYMGGLNEFIDKYSVILTIISLLITVIVVYFLYKRDASLRVDLERPKVKLGSVIILAIVMSTGFSRLLSLMFSSKLLNTYEEVEQNLVSGNIVLVIIGSGILAPIVEEYIFRGLVYTRLKQFMSINAATIVCALMFGLFHMNLPQGMYTAILGLGLCFVYEKFNTIWAPIVFHVSANVFSIIMTKTGLSRLLSVSMLSYVLIMLFELALTAVFFYLLVRKNPQKNS
ncbi:MAG: CPBP family intramembrane metalloprotease [Lachnospiraceae bacterium]|nr:CPBP family intramembrane metalloprotease [Lachnospiraceae bacterium]